MRVIALLGSAWILGFAAAAEAEEKRDKPGAQAKLEEVIPLARLDENFRQDLFATVKKYRQVLQRSPKNDVARQVLADAAVALAAQVEAAEAVGNNPLADKLLALFGTDLFDTMWRLGTMAGKGNAEAGAALGLLFRRGALSPADHDKACDHYHRAARSGHVAASYHAALCAADDDREESAMLMTRAANHGHAGAQERLGRSCLENEPRDPPCAVRWLSRAANQRRPSAMSLYGWMLADGQLVAQDLAQAYRFYLAAAENGDVTAQNNLGELLETGRGTERNPAQAAKGYRQAAEAGLGIAQFNLGRLYAGGLGVPQDAALAKQWLEKAEKSGVGRARDVLDWMEKESKGVRP